MANVNKIQSARSNATPAKSPKLAAALKISLADSYTLYLKTQNYHWNVTGPHFPALHALFETQYNDLFLAVDLIAERIRVLGDKAPGSFKSFLSLTTLSEAKEKIDAKGMVKDLLDSNNAIVKQLTKALEAAQKEGDEVTVGLIVERITQHEKNSWMLASTLES